MAARPAVDGEPKTELTEQDIRELECPEVACAVDALMDFMECFPETWGRKPRGSIVPLVPRHYGSEWLHEYLRSFLCVPYFVEAPEIRAWLLHVGILSAQKGHPTTFSSSALLAYDESRLSEDLQTLRQRVQDEIIQRAKDERPDAVEHLQELMRREDTQAMKMMHLRDLVYMKALRWMKKNKEWLEEIEMEQLLEELKLRQLVEIAPLEPEETPEGHPDEVVWHLDHLDLRPRKYHTSSNFSCGRCLILVIVIMLIVSEVAQVLGFHHKPDYANG